MTLPRPRLKTLAALASALLVPAIAACQDEPLFVSAPPAGDREWAYEAPYEGEFRAQDLEIAALVQLTESGSPAYLIDASFNGELTVSPYPVMDPAGLMTACGLWLLSPVAGDAQKILDGVLGFPWSAMFSPDGGRIVYAASEECPSAAGETVDGAMRVLELETMEETTLFQGEQVPFLRGWAGPDAILAMRNVPDLGWTYRTIGVNPLSEAVSDLTIEYAGFNLFIDIPSPLGDKVLLVDEYPPGSSWNSEYSLASLATGELIGEPWDAWYRPPTPALWSPDNRLLLYFVAGTIPDGLPVDVMMLDPETGGAHAHPDRPEHADGRLPAPDVVAQVGGCTAARGQRHCAPRGER